MVHYRYGPAVAGVELVLEQHARLLVRAGYEVVVLGAEGESAEPHVKVVHVPELRRALETEADVAAAMAALRPWCEWGEVVFVHNVLTMPFGLAATVALWRLADEMPKGRFVNWVHDLAALNPDYASMFPSGAGAGPGGLREKALRLLRQRHLKMRVVAISEWRARQFQEMTGEAVDTVIPNGMDPIRFLGLSEELGRFVEEQRLLAPGETDVVLFQPARVLRRKNIEAGIRLVAALRERGCRARLLVTAAPDGHNPASAAYHAELLALRRELQVEREVSFISEFFAVSDRDLAGLYQVSDVLWFPSRQEGFGLPLLEGILHRMIIFCADAPPMNDFGFAGVEFFDPDASGEAVAEQLLRVLKERAPLFQARRDVLTRFAWDAVWPRLDALLHGGAISPG